MKLKQDKTPFMPITLVIETVEEARAFAQIMDEVDPRSRNARDLSRTLSHAISNLLVDIPVERSMDYDLRA